MAHIETPRCNTGTSRPEEDTRTQRGVGIVLMIDGQIGRKRASDFLLAAVLLTFLFGASRQVVKRGSYRSARAVYTGVCGKKHDLIYWWH